MSSKSKAKIGAIPPCLNLRHTLRGHQDVILRVSWSPDGKFLGPTSVDILVIGVFTAHVVSQRGAG